MFTLFIDGRKAGEFEDRNSARDEGDKHPGLSASIFGPNQSGGSDGNETRPQLYEKRLAGETEWIDRIP